MRPIVRPLALALVLALAAACSGGAPAEQAAPGSSTIRTPSNDGTSAATPDPSGSSTTPTTAASPGAAVTTPPPVSSDPLRAVPPRPGNYTYAQTGETRAGLFVIHPDPQGTLRVMQTSDSGEGQQQGQTRTYSEQQSQDQVFLFRGARVFLKSVSSSYATQETRCRLDDPVLVVRLPLRTGSSWSDRGTCDGLTLTLTAEVLGARTLAVGGVDVPTAKLRYVITVKGDGLRQTTRSTTWLSQAHSLIVKSVSRSTGSIQGTEFTEERTERLLSLTPA